MTLIVAKRINGEVYILSDSLVVDFSRDLRHSKENTSKILVFPLFAVAFAGVIDLFWKHSEQIHSARNIDDAIARLSDIRVQTKGAVDFLICDHEHQRMARIAEKTEEDLVSCWLGSQTAFERFQRIRHGDAPTPSRPSMKFFAHAGSSEEFFSSYRHDVSAFIHLMQSNLKDVGGYVIPYVSTGKRNSFGGYAYFDTGNTPQIPQATWTPLNLGIGDNASGAYSIAFSGSESGFNITDYNRQQEFAWHSPWVARKAPIELVRFSATTDPGNS